MKAQKLWMIIVLTLTMSVVSCSSYLYTLYIPATAYNIVAGLNEGDTSTQYADAGTGLAKINREMTGKGYPVTLAKTYQAAYGKAFNRLPPDGNTGQAFDDMRTATRYFRNILKSENVSDADDYVLTRVEHHSQEGIALIAAVYRPERVIKVRDDKDPAFRKVLTPESPDYYKPYRTDSSGRPLDVVAEWAAVPDRCFKQQGQQAILLTTAANNVIEKKAKNNFWQAIENWENGNIESVVIAQDYLACQSLDIARG